MFFNNNRSGGRRRPAAPEATLSPRFARLVREAFWLVVVAAFLYLALILATYTRSDPGWSFSGNGAGAAIGNRGGFVGAWLSDVLTFAVAVAVWRAVVAAYPDRVPVRLR